ncbi:MULTISPECIES: thiosulfate ABC transporter substrate-binding protein CysP [Marinobacter]|uniref:Thiosulfate ABC transporter substrate-binding protein CysP n=1 Tax=Marinobacter xestospongiae TaxID=994319 RepID=A0ABU3VUR2_9GAMM|nr:MULTISPECIES: thiosulfate ABC transporter substrate-binding protein CysP [Marinobacter]MCG8517759.1 thiosulfate ABC transporter substrate-binding protein CysP [Pseudomonadales bacterium]MCK7565555.1 thiosulfate ABC transporter substrate-binding protein CysP [Marinobacter xestospongiae]MDV2078015.1 thiosulfate ABC transporter substrate-binding protein CysP [Marinobacter xestospongiae]UDL06303.1 thiosulfate ABC transporter substrate-binding protein CysP [Marinobacter sp. CA1]
MKHFLKGVAVAVTLAAQPVLAADRELLNTSYDIARELFAAYNEQFQAYWQETQGEDVTIRQSHAGSSRQAQAIIQGLKADVVTFNQVTDIDIIHERGNLLPENWAERLPNNSSPYYSTMAFLVRKDNPKGIENWDDLVREDVDLVMPNPKTSGNARYTYLAALGYAQDTFGDDQERIDDFLSSLLGRVKVFDSGGRGATTTFIERGIGDVLLTFESEVLNIVDRLGDDYQVVTPKVSFLAEFPVTWVDDYAEQNGNLDLAKAYLEHLYSEEAQRLLSGFNYRVHDETVKAEVADRFPEVKLLPIQDIAGSWENAMQTHFASGGKLDQLQRR